MIAPFMDNITKSMQAQSQGMSMQSQMPAAYQEESHDGVKEISCLSDLNSLINSSLGLIVDFWSPTCPPCLMFKPIFHKIAKNNTCTNIKFCSVNISVNREAAAYNQISVIPTFFIYFQVRLFDK